jgi:hypothetical protein
MDRKKAELMIQCFARDRVIGSGLAAEALDGGAEDGPSEDDVAACARAIGVERLDGEQMTCLIRAWRRCIQEAAQP